MVSFATAGIEPSRGASVSMGVDYVVNFRYAKLDRKTALQQFEKLVKQLASVGLATEARMGENHSILVFVRVASDDHLHGEVYRSRVNDWVHGVRAAIPDKDIRQSTREDPLHESERLRVIYQLITNSVAEGGAGITPASGEWDCIESIFALHDNAYNKEWIRRWSTKWLLTTEDLDEIRNRLGEAIAYYFAFTQSYLTFLTAPAAIGAASWLLLGHYSPIYAIASSLWCVIFVEYWKHQELDLALRWGVNGVSKIQQKSRDFRHEKETTDPITGETVQIFPATTRLQRQLLVVPFAILASLILGSLIAMAFGIEIFISEVYGGPLKSILTFLPTGILTTGLPILTTVLTNLATRLTKYENYETEVGFQTALTQKLFVLNFVTSYLPIFLTAFVYVPFGNIVVPYLDIFSVTVKPFAQDTKQLTMPSEFRINPDRLRKQVIYFTVTAQLVGFAMEVVVPYLKRQGFIHYKKMQNERAAKRGGVAPAAAESDHPDETEFLKNVRYQAELDVYDVTGDLREMVVQFGYLALFSVVWPLTGVSFLVNDWVELRADAVKICIEMQRPTPTRRDTIGPWLESLGFLAWLGSMTSAALTYLFSNDGLGPDGTPNDIKGWGLLLCVMFSEHLYLGVRVLVRSAISKIDTPGRQKERRDRYKMRKTYIQESLEDISKLPGLQTANFALESDDVSRTTLEEEARQSSLGSTSGETGFWGRQRNWKETAAMGAQYMTAAPVEVEEKKRR